ncbi:MAG: SLOG family protein [Roseburia sp.]
MVCCFFGHKDAPHGIEERLTAVLTELISEGVDSFLVGNQGGFDSIVLHSLRMLKEKYPHITYSVVLAYMPGAKEEWSTYEPLETIYPEGLESVHPRYAISWRNKWMIRESDVVVTYITHSWGGAAQFAELAEKKMKRVINIASMMNIKAEQ